MLQSFFSRHPHWPAVETIARRLMSQGHRVVLAGGCVRDALLGNLAHDLDIATDATPDQVATLFEKVLHIGKSFGVCRVIESGVSVEVATFREESDYRDGRHPEHIVYSSLEKDALRRDFTMNGMFFDLKTDELIDLVGGARDIQLKRLVTVGDARQRFQEDHLRVLRAARFAAKLGFTIEPSTLEAMKQFSSQLFKLSKERIQDEIHKAFQAPEPFVFFNILDRIEAWPFVVSGVDLKKSLGFLNEQILVQDLLRGFFSTSMKTPGLGWALFLWIRHKQGEPIASGEDWLKSFKLSGAIIHEAVAIIKAEDFFTKPSLKAFVSAQKAGESMITLPLFWRRLAEIFKAPTGWFETWQEYEARYLKGGELPKALVGGEDLIQAGLKPGGEFKALIEKAYVMQLENPALEKSQILKDLHK